MVVLEEEAMVEEDTTTEAVSEAAAVADLATAIGENQKTFSRFCLLSAVCALCTARLNNSAALLRLGSAPIFVFAKPRSGRAVCW